MTTILKANRLKGESIEYQSISMVSYFLCWAGEYAKKALEPKLNDEQKLKYSISSIMMNSLSLEAFINERAENVISDENKINFDRCRKEFANKTNYSNTVWKLIFIFNTELDTDLPKELLIALDNLMQSRHKLVHYKCEESARKIKRRAPSTDDMFSIDFSSEPLEVEPSLIEKNLTPTKAKTHYEAVLELARTYIRLNDGDLSVLDEYPALNP